MAADGCGSAVRSPVPSSQAIGVHRKKNQVVAVDLFAGAGGLSLGVKMAGAQVALAVEEDGDAAKTFRANHPDTVLLTETINNDWSLRESMQTAGVAECDLIIGGPPCQGWSSLGARGDDKRRASQNACLEYFINLVLEVKPAAMLFENARPSH